MLIQDVHDAVADLVEWIKTYQSKNKLSQVVVSSLFKRRQEEADAVIDSAMSRLQVMLPSTNGAGNDPKRCALRMQAKLNWLGCQAQSYSGGGNLLLLCPSHDARLFSRPSKKVLM